ncbi:rho guanine nucleotide exchange factor at 64C isoform 1-T27 [Glossina fuscipes fuscipes]
MYDKSKKTWSQRLKIQKNEKSQTSTTSSVTNTNSFSTPSTKAAAHVAHNVRNGPTLPSRLPTTQRSAATVPSSATSPISVMHLPTALQLGYNHTSAGANTVAYEYLPSALTRSTKYAEPWIYSTVRGIPARPSGLYHNYHQHVAASGYATSHPHAAAIFATPPMTATAETTAVAVVICSCPEYLNGTKRRDIKKATVCKKCKGTRLPLANIGGTVRIHGTPPGGAVLLNAAKLRPAGSAATVRVVSTTKKTRPSILDPQRDPYDLMRRTRLLSPEPGCSKSPLANHSSSSSSSSSKDKSRNRLRSTSPPRGRTRLRPQKSLSVDDPNKNALKLDESWLTESEDTMSTISTSSTRRSILRCNVNPYDLISIDNQLSATSDCLQNSGETVVANYTEPPIANSGRNQKATNTPVKTREMQNDQFNVNDAALSEEPPPFRVQTKVEARSKPQAVVATKTKTNNKKTNNKPNYSNIQAIAGQRISLGEQKSARKSLLQQTADGNSSYESFVIENDMKKGGNEVEKISTKQRPDTLKVHQNASNPESRRLLYGNKVEEETSSNKDTSSSTTADIAEKEHTVTVTVTPTHNIKSILKRPSSKVNDTTEIAMPKVEQRSPSASYQHKDISKTQPTPIGSKLNRVSSNSAAFSPSTPTANSQFYIPLPQARKKVQFMVEDKIAIVKQHQDINEDSSSTENEDDNQAQENSFSPTSVNAAANYEYYSKKREQSKLLHYDAQETSSPQLSRDTETECITYDEQFIQAMLLEKLQLDSKLVTQKAAADAAMLVATTVTSTPTPTPTPTPTTTPITTTTTTTMITTITSPDNNGTNKVEDAEHVTITVGNNKTDYEDVFPNGISTKILHKTETVTENANNKHTDNKSEIQHQQKQQKQQQQQQQQQIINEKHYNVDKTSFTASESTSPLPLHVIDSKVDDKNHEVYMPSKGNNDDGCAADDNDDGNRDGNGDENDNNERKFEMGDTDDVYDDHYNNLVDNSVTNTNSSKITNTAGKDEMTHTDNVTDDSISISNNDNDNSINVPKAQLYGAKMSTTENDADDIAIEFREGEGKQQKNSTSIRKDMQTLEATDKKTINTKPQVTQTRCTAVRRSQSERQPSYHHHHHHQQQRHLLSNNRSSSKDINKLTIVEYICYNESCKENGEMDPPTCTSISVNFKDTMALRCRPSRSDARDLFGRPREPPPPPPLPTASSHATVLTASKPLTMNTSKPNVTPQMPTAVDAYKEEEQTIESSSPNPSFIQPTNKGELLQRHHEERQTIDGNDSTLQSLVSSSGINEVNLPADNKDGKEQLLPQNIQNLNKTKTFISNTTTTMINPFDSPTIVTAVTSTPQKSKPQRTVVRVAPFNKNLQEIHRLKITHTDPVLTPQILHSDWYSHTNGSFYDTSSDCGQKKTSILINGDDCYSTINLSCDDASTPLYQSSVVVTDGSVAKLEEHEGLRVISNTANTVTINVSSPHSPVDEITQQHNKINNLLSRQSMVASNSTSSNRAIIPIRGSGDVNLQRSASSTSSTSTSSMVSCSSSTSNSSCSNPKRGRTLIRLDYEKEKTQSHDVSANFTSSTTIESPNEEINVKWLPHEEELLKILRNPVEAVKMNLVPHICGRQDAPSDQDLLRSKKMKDGQTDIQLLPQSPPSPLRSPKIKTPENDSFIAKLLEDPMLSQVADGLETETVAELIENSLKRLQDSRNSVDMSGTKDSDDMNRLITLSLKKIQEERAHKLMENNQATLLQVPTKDEERLSNRGSISSANSFASAHNYEMFEFDNNESDCYQSCSSEIISLMDDDTCNQETRSKFYQMLVDATLAEIELTATMEENLNHDTEDDEHQYESIRLTTDPIYEEISDIPPPLPLTAPPVNDAEQEKKATRSIFEGASKYDILSYLVDAKERGVVKEEEPFSYPLSTSNPIIIEEESLDTVSDLSKRDQKKLDTISSRSSALSDSSEDNQSTMSSLSPPPANSFMLLRNKGAASDIERNDSGVGSETSKSSRSKFQSNQNSSLSATKQVCSSPLHLCEDCDGPVETQMGEDGVLFAPLVCRKCGKKRIERKEIITEIVETEEKYGRDLQIILEEFCQPMLVAGLLTQEQLSAIFLNTEELLENNQTLAERMRDALDIALEQGDDDLLTVNIGKIFLESTQMLHAFESYCVRQAAASLLLANLEKEKELLRIFLKVSQMENAVLRRMNLNSFLMVPVQRVTKYPLLLARLYKVTPAHLEGRDQLKQAQEKIELHLNHINQEAKDVPTKLWRRISSSSPNRRASCEIDMINIKLRKMAIDVLEWNHDEVRFAMEGKLLYTQPTDSNWKKARTIKLTPVNALLVTNGKPSANYKAEKVMSDKLNFPKHTGIREASLLVVKEKCGRYTLIREPLYLDRCVVCSEADWDEYFEIQEISSKDTFIFKAEDNVRTKQWYTQLQYHAQGMGGWRKRRNALANIMINGMLARS